MAQTFFSSYFHVVFSTKNRFKFIEPEIEHELFAYIGGIVKKYESRLLIGNGTSNHVHLLLSFGKRVLIPDLIGTTKRETSRWIKTKGVRYSKFQWQDGYAAFSVGHTQINDVRRYIANQKEHHRHTLFEDEMRTFFRKYEIEFDEKYVWD